MRKPNLFIIGAAKAGTTTLHSHLQVHPDIFMSAFKEPAYFLGPTDPNRDPPAIADRYRNDPSEYYGLFASATSHAFAGESSVAYAWLPRYQGVVERIARECPDARFIYVMRDPVERTISHYWWNVRFEGETRDPLSAVQAERTYRDVSHYAMQICPYLEKFDKERIKVVLFEQLMAETEQTLRDLFGWLGVDASIGRSAARRHENVTPSEVIQLRDRPSLQRLRNSAIWNMLHPHVPAAIRRFGRSLVERPIDRTKIERQQVIDFLRPIQKEQTKELSELLGRPFPEWRTLNGIKHVEAPPVTLPCLAADSAIASQ